MKALDGKRILIVIENLPAPIDRRVWQEATTLAAEGAIVSIICPRMKGLNAPYERIDGIDIYRHPLPVEARGALGYLAEYGTAIFWQLWLTLRLFARARQHVIQGCSPPDLMFLSALPFKLLGARYVFDHHDPSPELYEAKFGRRGLVHRALLALERLTFKTADFAIATNESLRDIAIGRGRMPPDRVAVVRSGPNLARLRLTPGHPRHRRGKRYLVGYLGFIAEQDGLDLLMRIVRIVLDRRQDVQFAILGDGTELENVKALARTLDLGDAVDFHGLVTDDALLVDVLNTCDVCVNPDAPVPLNDLLTANKVMEYMALKKPVVQFDLKEGRFTAGDASLYAPKGDLPGFADRICQLLDDEPLRRRMGEIGYERVVNQLSWDHERRRLLTLYERVVA